MLIKGYQRGISSRRPYRVCRYEPTCSQYMLEAVQRFGLKGVLMGSAGFYAAILGPTVVSIQCRITLQSDEHIIDKGENVSKKEKTVAVSVKDIERNGSR